MRLERLSLQPLQLLQLLLPHLLFEIDPPFNHLPFIMLLTFPVAFAIQEPPQPTHLDVAVVEEVSSI